MHEKDLTRGPIPAQLWSLAWPMMLSFFFYTLYNLVDAYWVSKLSSEAIAAVSISQISLFIMMSLGFGVTVGSGVLMAMEIGAKNKPEAERILGQSFVLSVLMAVIFTAIAFLFRDELLVVSGAHGLIFDPARSYYTIIAGGSVLLFVMMAIMFAFNSQGDTTTLTKLFALSTGINIVLDPLLIFGWGGFPALGIEGAAYATLISQFIFMLVALYSLSRPTRQVRFRFSKLSFVWPSVKKVLNIGFPAALTQIIFPGGLAALTYITSLGFLEAGAVAFTLGFRVEFFAYLPAVGFGFGAMAMMGQNIGGGQLERARLIFKKALVLAAASAGGMGLLAAVFAVPIIAVFTQDALITEYARSYMWTVAFSYAFLAALMVEANAFQSINRSWPGFWIFFLRVVVITVPLSYILTQWLHLSIIWVWFSIVAGNVVAALVGYFWIQKKLHSPGLVQEVAAHLPSVPEPEAQVATEIHT